MFCEGEGTIRKIAMVQFFRVPRHPAHACSPQPAPRGRAAVLLFLLLFCGLCLNAGTVIWTLNASFSRRRHGFRDLHLRCRYRGVLQLEHYSVGVGTQVIFPRWCFLRQTAKWSLLAATIQTRFQFTQMRDSRTRAPECPPRLFINSSVATFRFGRHASTSRRATRTMSSWTLSPSESITSGTLSGKAAPDLSIAVNG